MSLSPVTPFEPVSTEMIPQGDNWIAQIKWDGVRLLTYCDGRQVKLYNRHQNERTLHYPELTAINAYCSAHSVILDGEVIALEKGKPSFYQVMKRDSLRHPERIETVRQKIPIIYMIFDLLYLNGEWVIDRPLMEREQMLKEIITPQEHIQLVSSVDDPHALLDAVEQHQLEGIVIKDRTSRYSLGGKDRRWQKKKRYRDLYAVVGGVTFRQNRRNAFLLGLYDDEGQLWYVGHAGAGRLTQQDWMMLTELVPTLKQKERPFVNRPERHQDAIWLQPTLVVKINFLEWTPSKTLRQPSIQSFVEGDASACTFNQ